METKEDVGIADAIVSRVSTRRCECCGVSGGGDASGAVAIVGGERHVVGGWAEFHAATRQAKWKISKKRYGDVYGSAHYINGEDAADSLLKSGGGGGNPLETAATALAEALGRYEDKIGETLDDGFDFALPALTARDVRKFAADAKALRDPDALKEIGDAVVALAASFGRPITVMPDIVTPPPPVRSVRVSDDEAVAKIERDAVPFASSVEKLQAAVASRMGDLGKALP